MAEVRMLMNILMHDHTTRTEPPGVGPDDSDRAELPWPVPEPSPAFEENGPVGRSEAESDGTVFRLPARTGLTRFRPMLNHRALLPVLSIAFGSWPQIPTDSDVCRAILIV